MALQEIGLLPLEMGNGQVSVTGVGSARLYIPARPDGYANAQLDDHRHLPRVRFPRRPGARMRLRARASSSRPQGTLGFGFWNDPFNLSLGQAGAARKLPAAPQAIWFFYGSEPNDIAFASGAQGWGWKAQCLRGPMIPPVLLAAPAAAAFALAQVPWLRRWVMGRALRSVACSETLLETDLDHWHEYTIEWREAKATFRVDGVTVLEAARPSRVSLGFVTWIDNQYAVASVQAGMHFGVIPTTEPQSLELEGIELDTLEA